MKKNLRASIREGWYKLKNNPSFTLKEQLGFASGSFGNCMGQDMIGTFFMFYMTDFMGITSQMLFVISLVAKIVNIIADPVAGGIYDAPPRNGKSRVKPFLLLTPFPISITSVLLFIVPAANMTVRIVYVFVFYLIFCISDAFYDMALMTTSARMTSDPNDRKNFYTVASFASTLGSMLPGGVIPMFMSMYKDHGTQEWIYIICAAVFGVVGLATMIMPGFTLKEKVQVSLKQTPVKINAKAILQNRPLITAVFAQIFDSIRQICYGALLYFYTHTLGAAWLSTAVGSVSSALSYVGIALIPFIGKKLAPRDIIAGGYLYTACFYIILLTVGSIFIGSGNVSGNMGFIALAGICIALGGFPNGAIGAARRIQLADSADYMDWKMRKKYGVGTRSEGMVFAVNSMAGRINGFWKDLLLPLGLTFIGYVSKKDGVEEVQQTSETLKGLFYLVAVPGVIGNLLPGLVTLLDNFRGKRRDRILAELMEMRKADGEIETTEEPPEDGGEDGTSQPEEVIA